MANHSSSHRNGRPPYFSSFPSLNSPDQGQSYASSREMAPPFQPHSTDIDLNSMNSSRTLPSLSALSTSWDNTILASGFGDSSYSSFSQPRSHHNTVESPVRGNVPPSVPNTILQWYTDSNDPWYPKVIPDVPEPRSRPGQNGNRHHIPFGGQYRHTNTSDVESFYGAPPSDSGYGTRRSVANTSVFSADVPERDQDCQSLVGHVAEYQPFQGFDHGLQRENRPTNGWQSNASLPESSGLICPTCRKPVKTQSELKKHELRHTKPFRCQVEGCTRTEGFSTTNDLDRHTKSKHPTAISDHSLTKMYRCLVPGCTKTKDKLFPRLDNFRSHLKRMHDNYFRSEEEFEELTRHGESMERLGPSLNQPTKPTEPVEIPEMNEQPDMDDSEDPAPTERQPEAEADNNNFQEVTMIPMEEPEVSVESPQDTVQIKDSPPAENFPQPEVRQRETVQPLEVFGMSAKVPETKENKFLLDFVLTPVNQNEKPRTTENKPSTGSTTKVVTQNQGKASRQHQVSAVDAATLTEVIKTVLVGTNNSDNSSDRGLQAGSQRTGLPDGPHTSWKTSPSPYSTGSSPGQDHKSPVDSLSEEEEYRDQEAQKKAVEVLKKIQDLGYTVQKETPPPPKVQNAGSIASNKSENQVTCPTCQKFRGRPCELKKHMKRHERPYGCTFPGCTKTFGSKNDWKRHENSQHSHLETWRCEEILDSGPCAKVCYRKQTFQDHLKKEHNMEDSDVVSLKLSACKMGRNCQSKFWCGFCLKLVELKKKGLEAWNERFDHIDDHFMGRGSWNKVGIKEWVPADNDKSKCGGDSPARDGSQESLTCGGSGSGSGSPGSSSSNAIVLDEGQGAKRKEKSKRSRSGDSVEDGGRHAKHPRTSSSTVVAAEFVVYCCGCSMPHNPQIDTRCTSCTKPHDFCVNCPREVVRSRSDE